MILKKETALLIFAIVCLVSKGVKCDDEEDSLPCKAEAGQLCFDDEDSTYEDEESSEEEGLNGRSLADEGNGTLFRLPTTILPVNYRLLTRPVLDPLVNFTQFTSPTKIWIQVQCLESTSQIVMHSLNLSFNPELTAVTNLNTSEVTPVFNHTLDPSHDLLILNLASPLVAGGHYQIFMDFVAPVYLNRKDGIYRTSYQDPANPAETKYLVSTLFAPTQARRAFPCFDEPQLKATFSINIGRTYNYTSLCNMRRAGTNPIPGLDGWFSDHYETTVPMSTYLVAFMISNFDNHTLEAADSPSGKEITTWADPHHISTESVVYATNVSAMILPFFENYLNYSYALPKVDSVAMPKISYAGMESWGLIIYQEHSLLYDPGVSTEAQRKRTTSLIAHELAHQWFGNLVTMDWWSDIWLSEGLSTYFQYVAVAKLYPEFDAWNNFISDVFQSALIADANSVTSHPLHLSIDRASEIFAIYDKIAYDKGASVVRMMEHFLTQPVLQAGFQNYVKNYAFKSIHQDLLFATLNVEAAKVGVLPENATVKDIMDTWTTQSGYPLIRVSQVKGENKVTFEQEKYDPEGLGEVSTWWVPITFTLEGHPEFEDTFPDLWLAPTEKQVSVDVARSEGEWLLVNAASSGFFRVLYDYNMTETIQRQLYLNHTTFPASARSRLIDDYFSISYKKFTSIETALNMISYIGKETDYSVWKTVFTHLKYISEMLSHDDIHLGAWLTMKLESVFKILDSELSPEQQEDSKGVVLLRRHFLLTWGCHFKIPRCVSYAAEVMQKWKVTPEINPVPQALKASVYCIIAGGNDTDLSQFLVERYREETDPDEKYLLVEGLGCARDMNMVQTELTKMGKFLLNDTGKATAMVSQEKLLKTMLKGAIKTSSSGRDVSWKFIQEFFNEAAQSQKLMVTSSFGEIVSILSNYWNTPNERSEFQNFINTTGVSLTGHTVAPALRTLMLKSLQSNLERVDVNIDWMQKFYDRVQNWFALENYYFPEGFLN